ncbi:hypothetical protein K435DRAFT_785620 [Dendrothele bispora CBS 962.96]|uniref:HRQ family protein 1 n=1 Tax=Dendrothele bispora (strain CBS 962.96) TaxID=1314807 RepID=A0A4S8KWV6_DENBC|nr:hypothetical protein K435DRAFT_785620 [Dendrothele bispora CBS 962.96]
MSMSSPQLALLLGVVSCALFVLYKSRSRVSSESKSQSSKAKAAESSSTNTKPNEREWGEWTPVNFTYPSFDPSTLDPLDMKPVPYRPFRWGQYHVTMGIRDMPWAEWIELDNQFLSYHYIRRHRILTRGKNVLNILPDRPGIVKSADRSAVELAHELSAYLSTRYPKSFTVTRDSSSGAIQSVTIVPAGATYQLPPPLISEKMKEGSLEKGELRPVSEAEAEEAMKIAALLVQDDLALMVEGTDGRYYFQGGAICVPGFWRMRDKIGLPLDEIHLRGHVPQYQEKLHNSMERYFKRMPVEKPIIRNNYFVQLVQPFDRRRPNDFGTPDSIPPETSYDDLVDPEELAWSNTTNGNEDKFTHGKPIHPDIPPVIAPENLRFRSERQTLRRLPLTGAIVFTIRTYLTPLVQLGQEPGIPARMASAVRSWPEGVSRYKGRELYEEILLNYLDECAEKQRLAGGEGLERNPGKGYPY